MKNIHVLPTDKPSRLIKSQDNDFIFLNTDAPNWFEINFKTTKQNIYITSDEEIKDVRPHKGKWQLEKGEILNKFPDYLTDLSECKLVIMTTDQDLIQDGVQAIDDEFLEWFVNNPSCEEVEVNKLCYGALSGFADAGYKIIIPKEESKQSTKDRIMSETSEETKQKAKDYGNSLVTKTETLQDIAENYATDKQNEKASKFYIALESFIAGYELANVVGHTMVQYHNQLINEKWIEILNKEDLPTNEGSYFVFSNSNFPRVDIFTGRLSNAWNDQHNKCHFTHYIKINKPNQPII